MKPLRIMLALAAASALAAPALAAEDEAPKYENGPVWNFTEVKTVDGHFDDYMHWLATEWKAQEEALKKAGRIVDYKVYLVADPRKDEPDLILAAEFKNFADFDRSVADQFAFGKQLFGSVAKADKEQADRSAIRTIQGNVTMRELELK